MGGRLRTREEKLETVKYYYDNPEVAKYKIAIIRGISLPTLKKWLKEYESTGDIKETRRPKIKTVSLSTFVEPELAEFVAELADRNNLCVSHCLRKIILYHYKKAKGIEANASA